MAKYQLIIRSGPPTGNEGGFPNGFLHRFKAAIIAVVTLATVVGVLLAALLLGSVFATLIIIIVVLVVAVWTVRALWRRGVRRV